MTVRHSSLRLAIALSGAAMLPGLSHAQQPLVLVPVRADAVMSRADLERTGVARLTPAERVALDGWLTRYAAELRRSATGAAQAPPDNPGAGEPPIADGADRALATARAGDGESALPTQGPRRRMRRLALFGAPLGAPLVATPEEGNYVRLADGTLWEVYLPDRTATVTWRRGDYVTVSRTGSGVGEFDHVLVNAPSRTRAHARFAGLVQARGR